MSDLCTWIDPRVRQSQQSLKNLLREGIFMAAEDDNHEALQTIFDKPGVEELFQRVRAGVWCNVVVKLWT